MKRTNRSVMDLLTKCSCGAIFIPGLEGKADGTSCYKCEPTGLEYDAEEQGILDDLESEHKQHADS